VTAAQLRLLVVLALELVANAVEKLHVALLRVLLQGRNEGVRHCTSGCSGDVGVGSVLMVSNYSSVTLQYSLCDAAVDLCIATVSELRLQLTMSDCPCCRST
jgi:hypothetical protein